MAEVQRRLEGVTIELEELTRLGLFTDVECKSLTKKQFEFENKINSVNKSVQDFKDYIAYVIALYRMVQIRRCKLRIADKKNNVEYKMLQRVKNLYEMAVKRFTKEVKLYFEFFQFCKEVSFQHATNKMCNMMIKYHNSNEEAWLTAARLYFHERNDPLRAIKLLQQGIGILHQSALYTECIQYEVFAVMANIQSSKINEQQQVEEEQVEIAKLIHKLEVYIKQSKQHVDDYKFYIDLVTFFDQFDCFNGLQINLIDFLIESHANSAETWDYLALREVKGLHYDIDNKEIIAVLGKTGFMNAITMYEKGLDMINQENRRTLWTYYIKCIIDFKDSEYFEEEANYPNLALAAFERAAGENCLADEYYLPYLSFVRDDRKLDVLKEANAKLPLSVDLWLLRMRIDVARNVDERIVETFQDAVLNLKDAALPIWELMHAYRVNSTCGSAEDTKLFYESAIKQGGRIADHFSVKYLRWLGKNMHECRAVYEKLSESRQFNEELYKAMRSLEREEACRNASKSDAKLEALHKAACKQAGQRNVNVWIDYIEFLLEAKPVSSAKQAIAKIATDVRQHLDAELLGEFEERYDETLRTKIVKRKRAAT